MQAAKTTIDTTARDGFIPAAPLDTSKRIGSTVYVVEVYVKNDAGETVDEKIMRLIRNDLNLTPSRATVDTPQTGSLCSERNSA